MNDIANFNKIKYNKSELWKKIIKFLNNIKLIKAHDLMKIYQL